MKVFQPKNECGHRTNGRVGRWHLVVGRLSVGWARPGRWCLECYARSIGASDLAPAQEAE